MIGTPSVAQATAVSAAVNCWGSRYKTGQAAGSCRLPAATDAHDGCLNLKGRQMALGWLAVLQMVPWSDVIKNAPKVADSAKKLWGSVGQKAPVATTATTGNLAQLSPEGRTIAALQARVLTLESVTEGLHEQMLASSELIKALAEQNTQLIRRAEVSRIRLLLLAGVTALVAVVALAGLTLMLVG